jgi:serine/threonine-protein kinase
MKVAEELKRLNTALAERYVIERELGRGGMAIVYLAQDPKHGRQVALKVLRPEISAAFGAERILTEIQIAAGMQHPHVIPLFDSGEAAGLLYFVMPYVEGESLRSRLDREKQLSLEDTLEIAGDIAAALDYANGRGILHRDVKPENILLSGSEAVVADFGIARAIQAAGYEASTQTGLVVGTPKYMSPEQASGGVRIDGRSDLYSFGCVVHEMLAGQPPFTGPTTESIVQQHLTAPPPSILTIRAGVPEHIDVALRRALAKTPADRYPDAGQFLQALSGRGTEPITGTQPLSTTGTAVAASPSTKSVAVLPFANMSADPENEYFADGITEEIIGALTKVKDLRVTSRTSAFAYKGRTEDIRAIGGQLNVANVLEGSVRKAGNRLRITAQLINVADGYHLWSEKYDRELEDVFAIQDEISHAIVDTLKVKLLNTDTALVKQHTENQQAYDLYLKGRFFWNQRDQGLTKGLDHFLQATRLDPGFAPAHTGVADSYNLLGFYCFIPPKEAFTRAKAAAQQAIELDERSAEAHTSLAFAKMLFDWDWPGAEAEFARAMELNRRYPTLRHWYSEYLMVKGRLDEALEEAKQAHDLDPLGLIINTLLGLAHCLARDYEKSAHECRRILDMDSTFIPAHIWLGLSYSLMGRNDEAVAVFENAVTASHGRSEMLAYLGYAKGRAGREQGAQRIAAELKARAGGTYVSPFHISLVYLGLGSSDEALDWLEKALEERTSWLVWLNVDPVFDNLRSEKRFQRILEQIGLTQ